MFAAITRALGRRKIETLAITTFAAISSIGLMPREAFVATTTVSAVAPRASRSEPAKPTAKMASSKATTKPSSTTRSASTRATMGLPNLEHPLVQSWIKRFTTSQRGSFATYLQRMERYEDMITGKLAARGMPEGLIYLAMIESGFNPTAKSPVKATGLWQFMTPTAKEYGLAVNKRVDERRNPARSTDAALRYLSNLHRRFGSWYLAAAAYNTGQGRVARVLKQVTGKTRGTDADYYRIANRLPKETRDYVPKLIAAARIGTNPEKYGFSGD